MPAGWFVRTGDLTPSIHQAALVVGIFALTAFLAWVGLGTIVRPLFMVMAMTTAWWYHRRSPWLFLTLTFWFWTLTPFIRRVIDYKVGFDALNVILVTPNLMTLLMIQDIVRSRTLLRRPETLLGLMLLVPTLYGLVVNLFQGQIFAGTVAAVDWITPLLYYFFLIDKAASVGDAEPHLRGFITINTLVVVGYGLNQFWNPPAWDVAWAINSGAINARDSGHDSLRVFSTLNIAGFLAEWLGALILLSLCFRTWLTSILLPGIGLLLLLTSVRSVTVGVLLGVVTAVLLGGGKMLKGLGQMLLAIALVGLIVITIDPMIADMLTIRFSSLGALQNDDSALVRLSIWASAPALIDNHPLGMGIGALGRGAAATGDTDLVSIDSGPLAIYLCLGWIAGSVYCAGVIAIIGRVLRVAFLLRTQNALALAGGAICSVAELAFVNVTGFAGCILWLMAGLVVAYGIAARDRSSLICTLNAHPSD